MYKQFKKRIDVMPWVSLERVIVAFHTELMGISLGTTMRNLYTGDGCPSVLKLGPWWCGSCQHSSPYALKDTGSICCLHEVVNLLIPA